MAQEPVYAGKRKDNGWAAGIFEGEGSICQHSRGNSIALEVGMTDEDVVRAFHSVVGVGTVSGTNSPNRPESYKPVYRWRVGKRAEVEHVMHLLLPYLGERRIARWVELRGQNYGY